MRPPLLLLLCCLPALAAGPSRVEQATWTARIVSLSGTARIRAGKAAETRPARLMAALKAGDEVTIGTQSKVVIQYRTGLFAMYTSEGSIRIDSAADTNAVRQRGGRATHAGSAATDAGTRNKAFQTHLALSICGRGGDDHETLKPIAPHGKILSQQPTFRWQCADGPVPVRVTVYDTTEKHQTVWTAVTEETRLPYPKKHPALRRGREYRWEIVETEIADAVATGFPFEVAGAAAAAALERRLAIAEAVRKALDDKPTFHLLAAEAHMDLGFHSQALKDARRVVASAPRNADAHIMLYYAHLKLSQGEAAAREEKILEKLDPSFVKRCRDAVKEHDRRERAKQEGRE